MKMKIKKPDPPKENPQPAQKPANPTTEDFAKRIKQISDNQNIPKTPGLIDKALLEQKQKDLAKKQALNSQQLKAQDKMKSKEDAEDVIKMMTAIGGQKKQKTNAAILEALRMQGQNPKR